ncbi:hypothetical protein [Kineosporia sp. NBRC 101731]|uniref:hypothetical protein n=1 Tax=Kineosporia sp. NBRC 101731 TaxID=3032199 RepID=UPI0024A2071F|nr:hypothetical protein [Kineosporia sp. NBRC 101731]GLY27199.1 hypothetical protein Kisp02_05640 [Kineosporia sp. NBRC 101731]
MNESRTASPSRAWTVRRARLVDIPAVSRMLRAPSLADWPLPGGVSDDDITSATRLMLTHVGLEHGEFWVADEDGQVRAAVVLLPPMVPTGAGDLEGALKLGLGLAPGLHDRTDVAELAELAGAPVMHWLLMPLHAPGDDEVLAELLEAALPAVDVTGMPVMCLEQVAPAAPIREAGFAPLVVPLDVAVTASLRPGIQAPDDAGSLFADVR